MEIMSIPLARLERLPASWKTRAPSVLFLLLLVSFLAGCVTEARWPQSPQGKNTTIYAGDRTVTMDRYPPRYTIDPPFGEDSIAPPAGGGRGGYTVPSEDSLGNYDPFKKYSGQTYYGDDGSVTRHYYLDTGMGDKVAKLVTAQVTGLKILGGKFQDSLKNQPLNTIVVWPNFLMDPRPSAKGYRTAFANYIQGTDKVADLMVVKTMPDKLREVDSYIANLQNEVPMIEIQVRVAELALTDSLQYGLSSTIEKITTGNPFLKGWLTNFNTETLKVSGLDNFSGALIGIGGSKERLNLDARLELLQRVADSEILAAPRVTVLDGHRAVIVTGDQTPVVKPIFSGNQLAYSYDYKTTGVTLVIVPHLLPGGIIQVELTAEVSSVTGKETIDFGGGPVQLPIVSRRNIGTKLRVEDGKEFVLGGLYSYTDIETISKIPLLGDIPVIGYLFKSQSTDKVKSEILFHIRPRVIRGARGLIEKEQEKP